MLTHVELKDFQCHDLLRVKLDPKITTIVGPSDSGKSAVVRALRWLVFNRPLGDSFIRNGAERVSVRVKVDGHWVGRVKGKGENCYVIDGEKLEAIGTGVPEQVSQLLELGPENFQCQHDGPFWFDLTPGEVARRLNEIVDLDLMDRVMSALGARVRRAKAERELVEQRLGDAEKRLKGMDFVERVKGDYDRLVEFKGSLDGKKALFESLVGLVGEVRKVRERLEALGNLIERLERLEVLGQKLLESKAEFGRIVDLVSRVKELLILVRMPEPDLSGLEFVVGELKEVRDRLIGLVSVVSRVKELEMELRIKEEKLEEVEKRLLEESGGRCPFCGGPLVGVVDSCFGEES